MSRLEKYTAAISFAAFLIVLADVKDDMRFLWVVLLGMCFAFYRWISKEEKK